MSRTQPVRPRQVDDGHITALLRELTPQVLATVARTHQDFDRCEDAVQEALLAASTQWPERGLPDNPRGWLITAASRRWIEMWRADTARRRRESQVSAEIPSADIADVDDSLTLFFLCAHPSLTPVSQVALTLRAVGGLTTAEIARALLVPEATVAQRISRAKAKIRESGVGFTGPAETHFADRLAEVLQVLYLVFNEGYTASSGAALHRVELSTEAIRLARQLVARLPDEGEVAGLLALLLLTDARRPARTTGAGALVPLAEQDRTRWDRAMITEGVELLDRTLPTSTMGPYQVQAAIAAVHDQATTAAETDWAQILGLYTVLARLTPGPMVTLNRLVAFSMVHGPDAGLVELERLEPELRAHHRVPSVRAHLLERAGRPELARREYLVAAAATLNLAERTYLQDRAAALR